LKTQEVTMSTDILDHLDDAHREGLLAMPWTLDIGKLSETRAQLVAVMSAMAGQLPDIPGVTTTDHFAKSSDGEHDILVRVYRPDHLEDAQPALFWIHGGGMVLGSVAEDDLKCKSIALASNCVIASVEYRLAPEFPYPTPVHDCYDAMAWVFENAEELHIDAGRIAIGGASAGAGLAAGTALMTRDRGDYAPIFQLLVYPMLDDRNDNPSHHLVVPPQTWNREANILGWKAYLGDAAGSDDIPVYAAPARAEDLSGLPPAYICVGTLDLFLDEDIDYARRLNSAHVPCELHVHPGAFHASEIFVPTTELSQRIVTQYVDALKRGLGTA